MHITDGSVPTVYTTQTLVDNIVDSSALLLECPYKSLWGITGVIWQRKTPDEIFVLDQSKDTSFYSGGTTQNSSLVIHLLNVEPNGIYRCFVKNKFGLGRGHDITVNIKPG